MNKFIKGVRLPYWPPRDRHLWQQKWIWRIHQVQPMKFGYLFLQKVLISSNFKQVNRCFYSTVVNISHCQLTQNTKKSVVFYPEMLIDSKIFDFFPLWLKKLFMANPNPHGLRLSYTLLTCCDVKTSLRHTVRPHWTLTVLSTSLTQLNCNQLQCIMVVNKPKAMNFECQWTT